MWEYSNFYEGSLNLTVKTEKPLSGQTQRVATGLQPPNSGVVIITRWSYPWVKKYGMLPAAAQGR